MRIGRTLRRAPWWLVPPVLLGVAVVLVGRTGPAPAVEGSVVTGPTDPAAAWTPPELKGAFRLTWTPDHRAIDLAVRRRVWCLRPEVRTTSTAPARLEVTVTPPPAYCPGRRAEYHFTLPLPPVLQPGQTVTVLIDQRRHVLAWDPDVTAPSSTPTAPRA